MIQKKTKCRELKIGHFGKESGFQGISLRGFYGTEKVTTSTTGYDKHDIKNIFLKKKLVISKN